MVAIAQEDESLEVAPGIWNGLEAPPTYPIMADINRKGTPRYERTTVYLVDGKGVVRQVLPMMTHMRATAAVLLSEIDRLR